jgi:hypothetical protein
MTTLATFVPALLAICAFLFVYVLLARVFVRMLLAFYRYGSPAAVIEEVIAPLELLDPTKNRGLRAFVTLLALLLTLPPILWGFVLLSYASHLHSGGLFFVSLLLIIVGICSFTFVAIYSLHCMQMAKARKHLLIAAKRIQRPS